MKRSSLFQLTVWFLGRGVHVISNGRSFYVMWFGTNSTFVKVLKISFFSFALYAYGLHISALVQVSPCIGDYKRCVETSVNWSTWNDLLTTLHLIHQSGVQHWNDKLFEHNSLIAASLVPYWNIICKWNLPNLHTVAPKTTWTLYIFSSLCLKTKCETNWNLF